MTLPALAFPLSANAIASRVWSKPKVRVDDRAQCTCVVEPGELAQLGATGVHEEELVAHAEFLGGSADLVAEERQHELERFGCAELLGESGVGWTGDADRQASGLEHGERLEQVLPAEGVHHQVIAREDLGESSWCSR